jgi:hypothetical protein
MPGVFDPQPKELAMMRTYLVTYDLMKPGQNYPLLHNAIKALSLAWWHNLESVWLIRHPGTAVDLATALRGYVDASDKLFVVELGRDWATYNLPTAASNWLRQTLEYA